MSPGRVLDCAIDQLELPFPAPVEHTCVIEVQAVMEPLPWFFPASAFVLLGMTLGLGVSFGIAWLARPHV